MGNRSKLGCQAKAPRRTLINNKTSVSARARATPAVTSAQVARAGGAASSASGRLPVSVSMACKVVAVAASDWRRPARAAMRSTSRSALGRPG